MRHIMWTGKDNESAFELHEAGSNISLAQYDAITRLAIRLRPVPHGADVLLDSDATPGLLLWGGAKQRVVIEGAKLPDVPAPANEYRARVIAYSVDQPKGVVWVDFDGYSVSIRD